MRDLSGKRKCQQEYLILQVAEIFWTEMEDRGVSRAELAKRLGKTERYVSRVLSGDANLTLRAVADVLTCLGVELKLNTKSIEAQYVP